MIYNVGKHRKIIGDYFFETDADFNIHAYKNDSLEFIEKIEIGYEYDLDEFISLCQEWIEGRK